MSTEQNKAIKDNLADMADQVSAVVVQAQSDMDAHEAEHVKYQAGLKADNKQLVEANAALASQKATAEADAAKYKGLYEDLLAQQPDPEPEPEPFVPRFPGDLGLGKYRVGWSLKRGSDPGWDLAEVMAHPMWAKFGQYISSIHDYASGSVKFLDIPNAQKVIDAGFKVVSQSCKLRGVSSNLATAATSYLSGGQDGTLRTCAEFMKKNSDNVFEVTVYHEPEDLTTLALQKALRDVTRYISDFLDREGVVNVVFMPVYMVPWTFRAGGHDPRVWHPDWNGVAWVSEAERVCPIFGGDVYNPLPPSAPKVDGPNREFGAMWATAQSRMLPLGMDISKMPKSNKEFGMGRVEAPGVPGGWLRWGKDCRKVLEAEDHKDVHYWDNSTDRGRYSLDDPKKMEAWLWICEGSSK